MELILEEETIPDPTCANCGAYLSGETCDKCGLDVSDSQEMEIYKLFRKWRATRKRPLVTEAWRGGYEMGRKSLEAELATARQEIDLRVEQAKALNADKEYFKAEAKSNAERLATLRESNRRLEQENKRLKAPVSDEGAPYEDDRCQICGWPLARPTGEGCKPNDCSMRPYEGSEEYNRLKRRREAIAARAEQEKPCVCHEVGCPFCDPQQDSEQQEKGKPQS